MGARGRHRGPRCAPPSAFLELRCRSARGPAPAPAPAPRGPAASSPSLRRLPPPPGGTSPPPRPTLAHRTPPPHPLKARTLGPPHPSSGCRQGRGQCPLLPQGRASTDQAGLLVAWPLWPEEAEYRHKAGGRKDQAATPSPARLVEGGDAARQSRALSKVCSASGQREPRPCPAVTGRRSYSTGACQADTLSVPGRSSLPSRTSGHQEGHLEIRLHRES